MFFSSACSIKRGRLNTTHYYKGNKEVGVFCVHLELHKMGAVLGSKKMYQYFARLRLVMPLSP
jgi:hypothetical protein